MTTSISVRKWTARTKHAVWAFLFLVSYGVSMVAPFIPAAKASALDTGWNTPTATHSPNGWDVNTVANVQANDSTYISENDGEEQGYSFTIPAINAAAIVNGVEVSAKAKSTDNNGCRLGVALSWNGGSNYTSYQYMDLGSNDATDTFGGSSSTWGRTWSASNFTAANFVLKIEDNDPAYGNCSDSATTSVDVLSVKVYYTVPVVPVANPVLTQACGLDIALVIDNSNSIDSTEMQSMKTALKGFTNALSGTPTQFSVTRFGTSAAVLSSFTSDVSAVNTSIDSVLTGGGGTNWEDGLLKAYSTFDPRADKPNLVIFASDGNPTYHIGGGSGSSTSQADVDAAISQANVIKGAGIRMLALGIGNDLSVDNLKAISGTSVNTGNVLTSDVITSDFSTLSTQLATFATQTCGGTITTKKLIDADGNLATTNDQTPAAGWTFDVNGGSNPDATVTDANGLTPAVKVTAGSGYSVSETAQSGYTLLKASCSGATNNGTWSGGLTVNGIQVSANNIISCTFINKRDTGSVKLIKEVVNNNGGTLGVNAFGLSIGGTSVTSGQTLVLPAGTPVAINEAGAPGYSFVSITGAGCPASLGGTVTPLKDQTITCTIKNDDRPATLIVNKVIKNDNGGNKKFTDFSYKINSGSDVAFEADGSNSHALNAGTYSVVENSDSSYATTYSNCTNIVLTVGSTATCTITNDDKPATITLNKTVVNHYGGTKQPSDFIPSLSSIGSVSWSTPITVNAGTYTASESTLGGYTSQGWTGDCAVNGVVAVANGENKTCSITNTDLPASLSGKKIVGNTDLSWVTVGTNPAAGWTIFLDQNQNGLFDQGEASTTTDADGNYSFTGLSASVSYYVKEVIPSLSGWEQITGVANPVVISSVGGTSANNNLTNKAYGTITVVKQIEPANDAGKFNLLIGGQTKATNVGDEGTTGAIKVEAGTYSIAEAAGTSTSLSEYTSEWACTTGMRGAGDTGTTTAVTVKPGENWTCTFTNTRKNGTVKVIKDVVNDNGGTKTAAGDFTFTNNGGAAQHFVATTNPDGEKTLTLPVGSSFDIKEVEANQGGYATTYLGTCSGVVTAQEQTCTIKNDDKKPKLTLVKHVVNNNGGTRTASEWTLTASGPTPLSGKGGVASGTGFKAGVYTLSETGPNDYTKGSWICNGQTVANSQITVKLGDDVTCKITNDDKAPSLTLIKKVINNNGGTYKATNWTLSAVGPTSISGAGGATSGSNFKSGSYTLGEAGPNGYDASAWDCGYTQVGYGNKITIKLGDHITCTITNNDKPVTISGHKKIGNTDLSWVNQGMNPVSGWVIYLDQNQNGVLDHDEQWTRTDSSGYYSFSGLNANTTYYVKEVMTSLGSGWAQITAPSPVFVSYVGGMSKNNDFKNLAQGTVTVIKNVDDGFGRITRDVTNWTWNYDGKQQDKHHIATGSNNPQTVPSGTYKISENQKPGYHVVASRCSDDHYPYGYDKHGSYDRPDEEVTVKVGLGKNVTCEFTNKRDTGTITVHKKVGNKLNPNGWTWWLEDNGRHIDMGNTKKVTSGWYWFGENGQDGYSFDSLKCKVDGRPIWVNQGTAAKVHVGKDDHVVCTFTNTRDTGGLTIIKNALPTSSQSFAFTITPTAGAGGEDQSVSGATQSGTQSSVDFDLVDDGSGTGTEQNALTLPTGWYRVEEASVNGWDLTDISCGEAEWYIGEDGRLYVYVRQGMSISCTFTNTQRAQLTIVKDARPNATRSFDFTSTIPDSLGVDTSFKLTDDGSGLANSTIFDNLEPGTYTITESATSAWKLDDIVCTGTGVTMSRSGYVLTVTLAAGAAASCAFINTFVPQVLGEANPGKGAELFDTGTETIVAATIALALSAAAIIVSLQRRKAYVAVRKD